jgi:hypothetical protein
MKPGNGLGRAGLRTFARVCELRGRRQRASQAFLCQAGATVTSIGVDQSPSGSVLSLVMSVGGGMVRHFTSFDVGRWQGRLVEKC